MMSHFLHPLMTSEACPPQPAAARKHIIFETALCLCLRFIFCIFFLYSCARRWLNFLSYRCAAWTGHHHLSPQLIRGDVAKLAKVPAHIAVILNLRPVSSPSGGVEGLLHDAGEVAGWCIGAGANELTIYERSGALTKLPPGDILREVRSRLVTYYGVDGHPNLEVRRANGEPATSDDTGVRADRKVFRINLLSEVHGRPVIVQLSRTFAEFTRKNELKAQDITVDFVDRELQAIVGHEPDLLIMFTPRVDLQGFPPWHIRVTEMFYLKDNESVQYLVFKRALDKFGKAKINLGR